MMNLFVGKMKLCISKLLVLFTFTFVTTTSYAQWNPGEWFQKKGNELGFNDFKDGIDDLGNSINSLGNSINNVGNAVNETKTTVSGFNSNFANINSSFTNINNSLAGLNSQIINQFSNDFNRTNAAFLELHNLVEFHAEQSNQLINSRSDGLSNTVNERGNFFAEELKTHVNVQSAAILNNINELGNFYETLQSQLNNQINALSNTVNERGNFYAEAVKGHVNAQTGAILNIVDERGSFYSNSLKNHVNDQTGALLNIVDERVNFYTNNVKDQFNSQVAGLDQNLVAKAQGITQDLSALGNNLNQTVSDKTEFLRGHVSEVQSRVSEFRTEVAGDFDVLGNDITQLLENLDGLTGLVESQISMFGFLNFECTDAELEAVQTDYINLFNNMQLTITGLNEIAPTELPLDCAIPLGDVNLLLSGLDINLPSNKIVLQMLCNLNKIIDIPCVFEPIPATIEAIKQENTALEAALGEPVCREFPRTLDIIKVQVSLSALSGADSMVPEEMVNLKSAVTVAKTLVEVAVNVFETLDGMNNECKQNQFRTEVQADFQSLLTDTPVQINQAQSAITDNNDNNTDSIQTNDNTNTANIVSNDNSNTESLSIQLDTSLNSLLIDNNVKRNEVVTNDNSNTANIVSNDNSNTESLSIQLDTTLNSLLEDNNVKRDEIVNNDNINRDFIKNNDDLNTAMILTLIDENQIEEYLVNKNKKVAALVIPSSAGGKLDMVRDLVWKRIQQFRDLNFKTKDADNLFNEGEKEYAKNDYKKAYENYMEAYQKLF